MVEPDVTSTAVDATVKTLAPLTPRAASPRATRVSLSEHDHRPGIPPEAATPEKETTRSDA